MRAATASCHVERILDDAAWERFSRLASARPAGFRIAALVRPPDADAGEPEQPWLERVRSLDVPFGLHTHWTSPSHARPTGGDPAERVRRELDWLQSRDLAPHYFSGGGWYTDDAVRAVVDDAGLVDLTATTFPLPYGGGLARAVRLPDYVHVYFHDTDLLDRARTLALHVGLRHAALRRPVRDLDDLSRAFAR